MRLPCYVPWTSFIWAIRAIPKFMSEPGMTLIAQRLSADLISISQANIARQITRDVAEYLILERYQVAMMQHEVISALHDSLEHDVAQTPIRPSRGRCSDTAVVVQPPSWFGQLRLQ